jgi:hypothetical protein
MDSESLKDIVPFLVDKPAFYAAIIFVVGLVTVVGWCICSIVLDIFSYLNLARKQRAMRMGDYRKAKLQPISALKRNKRNGRSQVKHFPIVTFADGTSAKVKVRLTTSVIDPNRYAQESNDPLGPLSRLVDTRLRQAFENMTADQAQSKSSKVSYLLTSNLAGEFLQYGIELRSIGIRAIQHINRAKA